MKRTIPALLAVALLACLSPATSAFAQAPPDAATAAFDQAGAEDPPLQAPADAAIDPAEGRQPQAASDGNDTSLGQGDDFPTDPGTRPEDAVAAGDADADPEAGPDSGPGADAAPDATHAGAYAPPAEASFTDRMKEMLVGLLLPEAERRMRKALGREHDPSPDQADAGDGFESAQAQESEAGTAP